MTKKREHIPVLLKEVLAEFNPKPGKKFIDATVGFGGHTKELLKKKSKVLGIEWDPQIVVKVKKRLSSCCPDASWKIVRGNFGELKKIAEEENFLDVDGILFDLGVSRWHYKKAERGFSFNDQSLDMRINPETGQTAAEIINNYSLKELDELFTKLVQEKLAEPIAETVVSARRRQPIKSGKQLAGLIEQVYNENQQTTDLHPATKVFLALRMEVNNELENLKKGLSQGLEILKSGGKILVITFHSGEDRLVKLFSRNLEKKGMIKTKRIFPAKEEINKNRLARSATLRIMKKIK